MLEIAVDNENRIAHSNFTSLPHLITQHLNDRLSTSPTITATTTTTTTTATTATGDLK
jgi:hypothetical protein